VSELHQTALAFPDDAAEARDFIETGEAAGYRLAVFTIVALVGIGRKAEAPARIPWRTNSSISVISESSASRSTLASPIAYWRTAQWPMSVATF